MPSSWAAQRRASAQGWAPAGGSAPARPCASGGRRGQAGAGCASDAGMLHRCSGSGSLLPLLQHARADRRLAPSTLRAHQSRQGLLLVAILVCRRRPQGYSCHNGHGKPCSLRACGHGVLGGCEEKLEEFARVEELGGNASLGLTKAGQGEQATQGTQPSPDLRHLHASSVHCKSSSRWVVAPDGWARPHGPWASPPPPQPPPPLAHCRHPCIPLSQGRRLRPGC